MAAHLEISCTNVLGLSCKGAAILEINKRRMKNDNIRKIVLTNYVTNVHKKQDCLGLVSDYFFFFVCKNNLNSRPGNWKHNIFLGLTGNLSPDFVQDYCSSHWETIVHIVHKLFIITKRPHDYHCYLYEIQVPSIYSYASLIAVRSCSDWSHGFGLANSVDPDPTPQNAVSDQGLHCLLK